MSNGAVPGKAMAAVRSGYFGDLASRSFGQPAIATEMPIIGSADQMIQPPAPLDYFNMAMLMMRMANEWVTRQNNMVMEMLLGISNRST